MAESLEVGTGFVAFLLLIRILADLRLRETKESVTMPIERKSRKNLRV